jgi:hypothetical protein
MDYGILSVETCGAMYTKVCVAESTEAKLSGDRNGGVVRSRYGHMNPVNN